MSTIERNRRITMVIALLSALLIERFQFPSWILSLAKLLRTRAVFG